MDLELPSKIRDLYKNWLFWLLLITGLAIFVRSMPLWWHSAWGCDSGIYMGLSKKFVESGGMLFNPYFGWGSSYNYFPVLYAITGFLHWITGIEIVSIMPKIGPIFGGLSVFIFYFVVRNLTGKKKIALMSCLILAVLPFHAYQTSHSYPLTIGHFFMMLSVLLFLKFRQNSWFIFPLYLSTVLLIMSHHLTTYFYLIILISVVFFENLFSDNWSKTLRRDILVILTTSVLIFSYWAFIAIPVYEGFMSNSINFAGLDLGSNATIVLFYSVLFLMFGFIWFFRRNKGLEHVKKIYSVKKQDFSRSVKKFALSLLTIFLILVLFLFVEIPTLAFNLNVYTILLTIPFIVIIALAITGFSDMLVSKNSMFIFGWLAAVFFSLIISLTFGIRNLFPHRHFEYLDPVIAIISAYGLAAIFSNLDFSILKQKSYQIFNTEKKYLKDFERLKILRKKQILFSLLALLLVSTSAASVYPLHESLGQSYEGVTSENINTIECWMCDNLNKNTSVIASDHRLERWVEASGFNTSQDRVYELWSSEDKTECIDELYGLGKNYTRITHVIIDDIMYEKVVHIGLQEGLISYYMTEESYEAFSPPIFELVYREESLDYSTGKAIHWTEVYEVNWTYLEHNLHKFTI